MWNSLEVSQDSGHRHCQEHSFKFERRRSFQLDNIWVSILGCCHGCEASNQSIDLDPGQSIGWCDMSEIN